MMLLFIVSGKVLATINLITIDMIQRLTLLRKREFLTDSFTDWDAPDWTGEFRADGSLTRFSSDANAKISLGWDLDAYEKLNFIHRKTPDGSQTLTLTVTEGNLKVEVYNGATW